MANIKRTFRDLFRHAETNQFVVVERRSDGAIVGSCPATEPLRDIDCYQCKPDNNLWVSQNSDKLELCHIEYNIQLRDSGEIEPDEVLSHRDTLRDLTTNSLYFGDCDTLEDFAEAIKSFQDEPYGSTGEGSWKVYSTIETQEPRIRYPGQIEGALILGDETVHIDPIDLDDLQATVFQHACRKAIVFCEKDKAITDEPPLAAQNPREGLNKLLLWATKCSRQQQPPKLAAAPGGGASRQTGGRKKAKDDAIAKMKKRFTFNPGQVLFDGRDLDLPSGELIEICKKLVENFGCTVPYKTLNPYYSSAIPGTLPKSVTKIRQSFKSQRHIVPCQIESKTNEGYLIQIGTPSKPRQKQVRIKS